MWEKFEWTREWFLNQSNPVKIGIALGACILIILIIFFTLNLVFPSDAPLTGDALEKYKASCNVISFQELISNVNKYNGQHFKFTGQIDQINVNNGRTEILLAVTQANGVWSSSDLIFVTYNAQTTFKKGDIVTVYGDVSGTYNYVSASLGNLTLVKITARYIELTPNTAPTLVPVPFTSPETNNTNTTTNSSGSLNSTNNNSTNPTNQPTNSNPSPTTSNGQPV
jgi:hypothetical protein